MKVSTAKEAPILAPTCFCSVSFCVTLAWAGRSAVTRGESSSTLPGLAAWVSDPIQKP